jgi:hypothetical protein
MHLRCAFMRDVQERKDGRVANGVGDDAKAKRGCTFVGLGCIGLIVVLIAGCTAFYTLTPSGRAIMAEHDAEKATNSRSADAPQRHQPTKSRQQRKLEFLASVDESISGARISGNPYKFVGKRVDLHCVVDNIPQADFVNASCPPDEYGIGPNVVVETNTKSLEKGQRIRVIGTVVEPMEGTNAMGGQMRFPTVKAEFME